MATFDQLSAEQRAIIELVLRQGKTYAELSDMLSISERRVRELARDALVDLAPVSAQAVDEDWRGQLADYVLGQQNGPEATATRGHLRRSEVARSWARSLLDSLDHLYEDGVPQIPDSERGRPERRRREPGPSADGEPSRPSRPLSAAAQAAVKRRRLAGAGLGALLLLLALLVWPVGLLTGDGDGNEAEPAGGGDQAGVQGGEGEPAGIAVVAKRGGRLQLVVEAASLAPSTRQEAYEVWLYNSAKDARSIGGQLTDQTGRFQAATDDQTRITAADLQRYRFIDVSREPIDQDAAHSGRSVLRGPTPELRDAKPQQGQAAIVGQTVLSPPRG